MLKHNLANIHKIMFDKELFSKKQTVLLWLKNKGMQLTVYGGIKKYTAISERNLKENADLKKINVEPGIILYYLKNAA